ncbi:MAG: dihydroorotase [Bacteroidetes bacterium]|nr:dihydroorotase [Bacteroidota bacterium]MDA1121281.1 dihydroorotase [Bacteroidota bacterium]
MQSTLILNARIVNEGQILEGDVLIEGQRISKISADLQSQSVDRIIDAKGQFLLPGAIDDQVHFREPGLTHKATIYTESRAAVAGGVTSFMEMPNTIPNALTQQLLADKYEIGKKTSLANYSFFMGVSNDNIEEALKTNKNNVCGLKIFMGSSTGNMLVDNETVLENIFSKADILIATHCEDEETIKRNTAIYREKYNDEIPFNCHPLIRSEEACYKSSSYAVGLAQRHGTKLHILHISTVKETSLFDSSIPLEKKRITSEACIHHLWFDDRDYKSKGSLIKWNPAVKTSTDREGIFQAVLDNKIDVIATDHAPHTLEEKQGSYLKAPSGGPLVQHSIVAIIEFYHQGAIPLERIVEKMCHNPAILFQIKDRGFIREGYYADLVLIDSNNPWTVNKENILAKCGWSPFEGQTFKSKVTHTFVSGHLVYENGTINEGRNGLRLEFER